jgi:hypothetical protein
LKRRKGRLPAMAAAKQQPQNSTYTADLRGL